MEVDALVRGWIVEVIRAHSGLLTIAVRQRAKFEGWLKFELAAHAVANGAIGVEVEASADEGARSRADLTFFVSGSRCDVELKTCNTNWRMDGVLNRTRPITKNISGIVTDAKKLQNCSGVGIVAFCMFPVSSGDDRWIDYLTRIGAEVGTQLSPREHATRVSMQVSARGMRPT